MSTNITKKSQTKIKSDKQLSNSLFAQVAEEVLEMQQSPLMAEIERIQESIKDYQDTFVSLGEFQKQAMNSVLTPMVQFSDSVKAIGEFQAAIADTIKTNGIIQDFAAIQPQFLGIQNIVENITFHSGILEVANSIKSLQVDAFAGLIIRSDYQKQIGIVHNGISKVSTIETTKSLQGGIVKIGIKKDTSLENDSQVSYHKIERMETTLQLMNEDLSITKEDVQMIKKVLIDTDILYLLQNNPLPFFRIQSIKFNGGNSTFLINNAISVTIPSKTLQDYLCQVLFSGYQENLTDEWDYEDIKHQIEPLVGMEAIETMTWKKIQEAVSNINVKIAIETTKKDVIQIPRTETVQLNPLYFS